MTTPPPTTLHMLPGGRGDRPAADGAGTLPPLAPRISTTDWLAHCSDAELAVLLTEHFLLTLPNGPLAALVEEVIERLERRALMLGLDEEDPCDPPPSTSA
jgi:hypothetical protein